MKFLLIAFLALALCLVEGCASLGTVAKTSLSPAYPFRPGMKVAVLPFEVSGAAERSVDESHGDAVGMALMDAGFTVIERSRLKGVTDEHKLGLSGLLSDDEASKLGKMLNADLLLIGTKTVEWVPAKSSGTSFRPLVIMPAANFESRKEGHFADVSLSVRLVDVKTGEVAFTALASRKESTDLGAEIAAAIRLRLGKGK